MELSGRRRVRSGWAGSHSPPEKPPSPKLTCGRVTWRDHQVQAKRGFSSFLDLELSVCESPLNTASEVAHTSSDDFRAHLWYSESDFEATAGLDEVEIAMDTLALDRNERVLAAAGLSAPEIDRALAVPVVRENRNSYEELRAHEESWVASRASSGSSPSSSASPVHGSNYGLEERLSAVPESTATMLPVPPTPLPCISPSLAANAPAMVQRLAHLLEKHDHVETTPTSVCELMETLQLLRSATPDQIDEARGMVKSPQFHRGTAS
mmetsp:Transcript_19909/g.50654  ORF Transcript_19909/g.50654 Transcript_19909/m.50654 type:complete len:266 (+) Transcript_19909:21-818(+)